jgi:hypothetical protein
MQRFALPWKKVGRAVLLLTVADFLFALYLALAESFV